MITLVVLHFWALNLTGNQTGAEEEDLSWHIVGCIFLKGDIKSSKKRHSAKIITSQISEKNEYALKAYHAYPEFYNMAVCVYK